MSNVVFRKLRSLARRCDALLGGRVAILLYHRIADCPADPFALCVSPRHFAEHLEVLSRFGRVMSLAEVGAAVRERRLPRRGIAVTFDDGYADNLHAAKPLLQRHGVPAAVFMTTGDVGRTREFWWDELERLVLCPTSLPTCLQIGGRRWELDGAADWPDGERLKHADWNLTRPSDPTPRHALLRGLHGHVRTMPHAARESVLDVVAAWAGVAPEVRPDRRAMTDAEVVELARGGLVEIGAHTATHPSLPALAAEARLEEMLVSRRRLREVTGGDVTSFAYPYGDHDHDTMLAAREAGFELACACLERSATRRSHPYALPRVDVLDWDGDSFAARLEGWLRG